MPRSARPRSPPASMSIARSRSRRGLKDGVALIAARAGRRACRVGCAPDTVLGAAVQEARRRVDAGGDRQAASRRRLDPVARDGGLASQSRLLLPAGRRAGLRHGPLLHLDAGPAARARVHRVVATGQIGFAERIITTETSPLKGTTIKVETLTTVQALLDFASGTQITFMASWDVWNHGMLPIEIHGTEASLRVPGPQLVRRRRSPSPSRARPGPP